MPSLWRQSGTIARNNSDLREIGALAYFFEAGTTTPLTVYTTADADVPHAHPLETDANGRWPDVFIPYETFRERVTEAWIVDDVTPGQVITDIDDIPNPAPPAPEEESTAGTLSTGNCIFSFDTARIDGFVRLNGQSIGSATSGATELASADAEDLFVHFWDRLDNTAAPVSGGRGASGATDFGANKKLTLPDLRGVTPVGIDTMGNSAASRFNGVSFVSGGATTMGSIAGANTHTLTTAQIPAHSHGVGTIATASNGAHTHDVGTLATAAGGDHNHGGATSSDGAHTHDYDKMGTNTMQAGATASGNGSYTATATSSNGAHTHTISASGTHTHTITGATASNGAHTHTMSGSTANEGSGNAHPIMQRSILVTWHAKL